MREIGNGMVLPVLFAFSTLDHEAYSDHDEGFRKIFATPTPATTTTDYGKAVATDCTKNSNTLMKYASRLPAYTSNIQFN